jgi:hypothetical protein
MLHFETRMHEDSQSFNFLQDLLLDIDELTTALAFKGHGESERVTDAIALERRRIFFVFFFLRHPRHTILKLL